MVRDEPEMIRDDESAAEAEAQVSELNHGLQSLVGLGRLAVLTIVLTHSSPDAEHTLPDRSSKKGDLYLSSSSWKCMPQSFITLEMEQLPGTGF